MTVAALFKLNRLPDSCCADVARLDSSTELFAWALVHSSIWTRELKGTVGEDMAAQSIEQKALGLLNAFESAGKSVSRVTVDGRKIEIVLDQRLIEDEYDGIDMRHGKT
ncbi:MAG: hypothetical protein ABJK80_02345 [Marinomonas sp.]